MNITRSESKTTGIMIVMSVNKEDKPNRNVHLGFPNAALDSTDIPLDLNKLVVKNRSSTFYMRVEGDSWEDLSIYSGDILTIDRALNLRSGDIFVGTIAGEFVLGEYKKSKSEHNEQIELWGVVTYVIHKVRR